MKTLDVILRITALIAVTILFIAPGTILLIAGAVLGLATLATAAIAGGLFCLIASFWKGPARQTGAMTGLRPAWRIKSSATSLGKNE